MQVYLPSAWFVAALVLAIVAATVAGGRALTRHASLTVVRIAGWSLLVVGSVAIERALAAEPPGVRMLSLIAFAMVVLKTLVIGEARARGVPLLGSLRFLAFTLAWPGMRPELFVARAAVPEGETASLFRRGAFQLALGATSLVAARAFWGDKRSDLLTTSLLLVGISLVLHFGLLSLLAAGFRRAGVACEALFRAPLLSESLTEFWSRRWNIAFSEMTALVVYRPLGERFGRAPALVAGFALSGFLHELAISAPVRAGFGLPSAYFALHALGVSIERWRRRVGRPVSGWSGRVWTLAWVILPLPLLFHGRFVEGVLWPLLGASR
jgi:hypothetical protein